MIRRLSIQKIRIVLLQLFSGAAPLLCIHTNLLAQFNFEYSTEIEVKKEGAFLSNPWAGGLDYAQLSTLDYDFDGDLDLFIFDRSSDNIRIYSNELINGQRTYKYVYGASRLFPNDLNYRATIVDYDNDGRGDLFTYSIGGLKVYRNVGNATDGLQWQLVKPIVYSNHNGFNTNLYVASSDIPAITDIDNDGDIDILTFHQGGQHLEYHKNMSMERYGTPDSLEFELANQCWGKFSENANNNSVQLNETEYPCENSTLPNPELPPLIREFWDANTEGQRHAGSTVLAIDYDGNGVKDLILGDVSFENLVLLINGGTAPNTNSPMISADNNFPSNTTPASMYLFPASFYVDVDFDNRRDLIVAANAKNVSKNERSILYYKNEGTDENPTFVYKKDNFLQEQQIDHGKGSIPILYDVDKDGKKDLLVANLFRFKNNDTKESTIAYYKNTGTNEAPQYTFIDYNWQNINQYGYGLRLVPTFGDINGDGKDEMILGRENGTLVLFQSTGNNFHSPQIELKDNLNNTIQVGGFSFPQLVDINNDGLLDLVVGSRTGKLWYYQNIGSTSSPSFQLINNNFGGITINYSGNPDGYAAPHFFKHNNQWVLFLGAIDGKLRAYKDISENIAPGTNFTTISDNLINIDIQGYSSFAVTDLDQDGKLNLFAGTDLGGLLHFEDDPNSSVGLDKIDPSLEIQLYPNPATEYTTIKTTTLREKRMQLIDLSGKLLHEQLIYESAILDLRSFKAGIYFIRLKEENQLLTYKLIISK